MSFNQLIYLIQTNDMVCYTICFNVTVISTSVAIQILKGNFDINDGIQTILDITENCIALKILVKDKTKFLNKYKKLEDLISFIKKRIIVYLKIIEKKVKIEFKEIKKISKFPEKELIENEKTILLLGNTGSGKSTFIELSGCNKEISDDSMNSFTKKSTLYKFSNNYEIIDTPGIHDSDGKTRKMMDELYDKCILKQRLNCVVIFYRYGGMNDEIVKNDIRNYTLMFPECFHKQIILCFTVGQMTFETLNELKKYYKDFGEVLYFNTQLESAEDQFEKLIKRIKNISKKGLIITKTMNKLILANEKIKKLEKELKEYKNIENLSEIKKEIKSLKKTKKLDIYNDWRCIGITQEGNRCERSKLCYFLHNHRHGYSPMHQKIMTDFDITENEKKEIIKNFNEKTKESKSKFILNDVFDIEELEEEFLDSMNLNRKKENKNYIK